jgi:hypothetical protein
MAMKTENAINTLAKNLAKEFPRSPRDTLGGYVVAARALDKCRAELAGSLGEYHFNCPLDQTFFEFSGIDGEVFREYVATGASDEEVADWIQNNSKVREHREVIEWNNKMRYMRPCDMDLDVQEFLEGYIAECLPKGRIVYVWFDVYDIEEKRM